MGEKSNVTGYTLNASLLLRQPHSIPELNSPGGGQIGYTDAMCPAFNLLLHPPPSTQSF